MNAAAAARRRRGVSSAEGTARVLALAIGLGTLVFGALAVPSIAAQTPLIEPVWTVGALAVSFAAPTIVLVAGLARRRRLATLAGRVTAIGTTLALVTLPLATHAATIPQSLGTPWVLGLTAIGTSAAAMSFGPRMAASVLVVTSAAVVVVRVSLSAEPDILPTAVQDALFAFCFDLVLASLVVLARRSAVDVDAAVASAGSAVVSASAARARDEERVRISSLVHDRVLSTLLVAAQAPAGLAPAASAEAERTLRDLDRLITSPSSTEPVPARDLAWALQSDMTSIVPSAVFGHEVDGDAVVDAALAAAVREATSEALRNSRKHASDGVTPVNRALHVAIAAGSGTVSVLDDGRGFDPDALDDDRLGLALSIRRRVAAQQGADVVVVSQPGVGTRVQISWRRP